jgi:hypothetical protein
LLEADETRPARGGNVGAKIRAPKALLTCHLNPDPAVDDWDEVSICNQVEHEPWPRPIDTTEQDVAIKRGSNTIIFDNAAVDFVHGKRPRSRTLAERTAETFDL